MKSLLLSLLMGAFLTLGLSACADRRATDIGPTSEARNKDAGAQSRGATKPTDAPTTNIATAAAGKVQPADALKLILLQLVVAR